MSITGQITINETILYEVDESPLLSGGVDAPIGSMIIDKSTGGWFVKNTLSPTGWVGISNDLALALKADKTIQINTVTGLTAGGGDLSENRTISVDLDSLSTAFTNSTIQTTSTSFVNTDLTLSLTSGKWLVLYSTVVSATSNSRLVKTVLYNDSTELTSSLSSAFIRTGASLLGGLLRATPDRGVLVGFSIVSVASTSNIVLRWNTSNGTAAMQERQLYAVRIG